VRPLALVLVLGAAALVGGCRRDCLATCEARQKVLKCERTNCKASCDQLHDMPVCKKELAAFEACFVKEPADKWECDESREPAVKSGVCSPERAAVLQCVASQPAPASK
jgi:hypothetical protein